MGLTIDIYVGKDAIEYIDIVSELRIQAFKEYPYLYEGNLDYEREYVHGYAIDGKAMIAVARTDNKIVGISTGIPLVSDSEIVADAKKIFAENGLDVSDYYYYGEVIVLPDFRGRGVTSKLYAEQDNLIKSWGYKHVCILTVMREIDHPLRPANYKSPDKMWEHLGFFRNKLITEYHWPTIQPDMSVEDVKNYLEFWTKDLINKREYEIGKKTEGNFMSLSVSNS